MQSGRGDALTPAYAPIPDLICTTGEYLFPSGKIFVFHVVVLKTKERLCPTLAVDIVRQVDVFAQVVTSDQEST